MSKVPPKHSCSRLLRRQNFYELLESLRSSGSWPQARISNPSGRGGVGKDSGSAKCRVLEGFPRIQKLSSHPLPLSCILRALPGKEGRPGAEPSWFSRNQGLVSPALVELGAASGEEPQWLSSGFITGIVMANSSLYENLVYHLDTWFLERIWSRVSGRLLKKNFRQFYCKWPKKGMGRNTEKGKIPT